MKETEIGMEKLYTNTTFDFIEKGKGFFYIPIFLDVLSFFS